jgi:hypothetical protein
LAGAEEALVSTQNARDDQRVSRVIRRPGAVGVAAIEDDLFLIREHGAVVESRASHLAGTLLALGLPEEPVDVDLRHARQVLTELIQSSVNEIRANYPERVDGRGRTKAPWQRVAAESLDQRLLAVAGSRGQILDIRGAVARTYGVSMPTVKRNEDDLIRIISERVHARITAPPQDGRARPRGGLPAPPPPDDPLYPRLGATHSELATSLLHAARLPGRGFEAQQFGLGQPSRVSTGIVTYVLANTPSIGDEVIDELYQEILGWLDPGGVITRGHGSTIVSTWTEGQCLLALTSRPHLVPRERGTRLADAVARHQTNGGWPYRTDERDAAFHPLFSFYPLLALQRAAQLEWLSGMRYRSLATQAGERLAEYLDTRPKMIERLLAHAALKVAIAGSSSSSAMDRVLDDEEYTTGAAAALPAINVHHGGQPVWHAVVNPSLHYLHSRRVLGPGHDFTVALAQRLLDEYDPINQGWTNGEEPRAKPYSWTTALGLLSCQVLRADLNSGRLGPDHFTPPAQELVA